ncbi:hypothetical protein VPH35_014005 [Triticum aestivum]
MAEARGDAGAADGDVVELQGAVTADVGGVHGGAGKLTITVYVEKEVAGSPSALQKEDDGWGERKLADYDPYDPEFSDDEEYEGNVASFTAKEVKKIKAKGVAFFYNRKIKKWHCPYCTTKPKPKYGRFDHLLSHAEDVAIRRKDYMIRGQHAALAKALTLA